MMLLATLLTICGFAILSQSPAAKDFARMGAYPPEGKYAMPGVVERLYPCRMDSD